MRRREGWGGVSGENFCAIVRAELFRRIIYCAKLRPDIKSQSLSYSCRGTKRRDPQIMREYNLVNIRNPAIEPSMHV